MFLRIDHSSGVPIYRQIMNQIKYSIANGTLATGEQLPSVRQLALELKVNPNTVIKAYSELEHENVIETRRGTGTFVSLKKIEIARDAKMDIVAKLVERLIVEAVHLDLPEADLRSLFNDTLDRYYGARRKDEIQ